MATEWLTLALLVPLVIVPIVQARWHVVDDFEASHRAEGGFGSTGR